MRTMLAFIFIFTLTAQAAVSPIPVKITVVEALSPKDTTSSERFQHEYEAAIATAKKLAAKRLETCGYQIQDQTVFFDASDSLQALEKAKDAEANGAWLIIGPRRSNHYVLLAKGAPATPSVSTMASSDEVDQLGTRHLSTVVNNHQMAVVAAQEAKKKTRGTKHGYVSVVSEDCVTCVDFSNHFDKAAKKLGLKKLKEFHVSGEAPSFVEAENSVRELKPSFVLLPDFSRIAASAMAAIHKVNQSVFYVGGDGWGDSKFGFVQDAKDLENVEGITVRGFPTPDEAMKRFDLGKRLLKKEDPTLQLPGSGPTVAIVRIFEGTTNLLCKSHPKSRDEFTKVFEKSGRQVFKSPWDVSVYNLKNGNIIFEKTMGVH